MMSCINVTRGATRFGHDPLQLPTTAMAMPMLPSNLAYMTINRRYDLSRPVLKTHLGTRLWRAAWLCGIDRYTEV
jgi:hypothetical protein